MPPHVAEAVTPTCARLATGSAGQTSTADVNGLRLVAIFGETGWFIDLHLNWFTMGSHDVAPKTVHP